MWQTTVCNDVLRGQHGPLCTRGLAHDQNLISEAWGLNKSCYVLPQRPMAAYGHANHVLRP